jgi:hypothetical protein
MSLPNMNKSSAKSETSGAQRTATQKPTRGRPKKFVDLELVEKLAHIQCTYGEIASTLGVSVDTLQRNKNFAATYKRGAEGGRKSLRRMQFESANKGNIVMQIWLGKQYLGQSDQGTIQVRSAPSLHEMTSAELAEMLDGYSKQYPELVRQVKALDADFTVVKPQPQRPAALLSATCNEHGTNEDE